MAPLSIPLSIFARAAQWQQRSFTHRLPQAQATQAQFLQTLLKAQTGPALGQALGLGHVTTLEEFRQQVPRWSYDSYAP